ncbi:hypothetical protein [Deinococcus sp. UYEF24]
MTVERAYIEQKMVDDIQVLMHAKFAVAREKGRGGWADPADCSVTHLWDCLREHTLKSNLDMVDVANLAGMVWWRLEHVPGDREALSGHLNAASLPHSPALPGQLVRHKKGGLYRVLARHLAESYLYPDQPVPSGLHTATVTDQVSFGEQVVIYQNIQTKECWARPARLFDQPERFSHDLAAAIPASAEVRHPNPEELAAAELEVLSLNWMTLVHLSRAYRAAGHDIDRKMEAECGFVLYRLMGLARKYGTNWREHAAAELKEMMAAAAPTGEVSP